MCVWMCLPISVCIHVYIRETINKYWEVIITRLTKFTRYLGNSSESMCFHYQPLLHVCVYMYVYVCGLSECMCVLLHIVHTHTHMQTRVCVCVCMYVFVCAYTYAHSSYMTLIGVHEMHGRVNPNQCRNWFVGSWPPFIIDLLYDDPPPSRSQQIAYINFGC